MATKAPESLKPAKKRRRRKKAKRPPHRPPHAPTQESKAIVRAMVANGATEDQIANYLTHMAGIPCSHATLAKHYQPELKTGRAHAVLTVGQSLYKKAVGAPAEYNSKGEKTRDEIKPEVTAQIFYLKARAGWRDIAAVEHSGPGGKPIPVNISSLSDTQLEQLLARLKG